MNYTKTCWYCKIGTMQPKCDYYLCTECGATWNEQPSMTGSFIDTEPIKDKATGERQSRPVKRSRRAIKR
uniref:Uncharacterized protein n=1 Tax=viral metagenome TaxID=1070528 RepID=A0A6M3Y566_9ZZZZ